MTGITTHLLDIGTGRPLAGVQVELYDVATDPPTLLNKTTTNADGRTNAPMLPAAAARTGQFELRFHVGEYFKSAEALSDVVPVRFAVFDAAQHYHIPMLCAPQFLLDVSRELTPSLHRLAVVTDPGKDAGTTTTQAGRNQWPRHTGSRPTARSRTPTHWQATRSWPGPRSRQPARTSCRAARRQWPLSSA